MTGLFSVLANAAEYGMGTVAGLGMGTVFAGLICLVVLISLLNLIFNKIPEKQPVKEETKAAAAAVADEKMDDETVAAVSAAIAEVLGRDVSGIRITSIKKIN